jgi:hypothetical protein
MEIQSISINKEYPIHSLRLKILRKHVFKSKSWDPVADRIIIVRKEILNSIEPWTVVKFSPLL